MSHPSDDALVDARIEFMYSAADAARAIGLEPCVRCYGWFRRVEMVGPLPDPDTEETTAYICTDCMGGF